MSSSSKRRRLTIWAVYIRCSQKRIQSPRASPLSLCLVLLPAAPAGEKKEQPDLYLSDINSQIFPSFELLPPQWLRLSFSSIFRSQSIAKKPWTKESHLLLTSSTPLLVSTHLLPLTTPWGLRPPPTGKGLPPPSFSLVLWCGSCDSLFPAGFGIVVFALNWFTISSGLVVSHSRMVFCYFCFWFVFNCWNS